MIGSLLCWLGLHAWVSRARRLTYQRQYAFFTEECHRCGRPSGRRFLGLVS